MVLYNTETIDDFDDSTNHFFSIWYILEKNYKSMWFSSLYPNTDWLFMEVFLKKMLLSKVRHVEIAFRTIIWEWEKDKAIT